MNKKPAVFSRLLIPFCLLVLQPLLASAANFDPKYQARRGDINADGRADIYLRYQPQYTVVNYHDLPILIPRSKRTVADFVLQQDANGAFQQVGPLDSLQRSNVAAWAQVLANLIYGDFNADGRMDVWLNGINAQIPGAQDAIVFAPASKGASPLATMPVDANRSSFIRDFNGWVQDPTYFNSGLYWVVYTQWMRVLYFDCGGDVYAAWADDPSVGTTFWNCEYIGSDWVYVNYAVLHFDPTGFSLDALDVLNHIAPYINDAGRFSIPAADTAYIQQKAKAILGVNTFGTANPEAVPLPWEGDWDWLKWINRAGIWLTFASLVNSIPGDHPNYRYLFRVMDDVELAGVVATEQFSIAGNPSGFEAKQFWTNIDDARAYMRASFEVLHVIVPLTIVEAHVSQQTYDLGYSFTDYVEGRPRAAKSYDPVTLVALNADVLRYGGVYLRDRANPP